MTRYDSFMLRIWHGGEANGMQWAGKLQHLPGGENMRFSSPEALLAYLDAVIAARGVPPQPIEPHGNVIRFDREGGANAGE